MRPVQGVDFLRMAATLLYRLALGHLNSRVIFQNTNDRDVLRAAGAVRAEQAVLIRGSGVSLDEFQAEPEPPGPPVAIMAARLLRDKGVEEFVEAARLRSEEHTSELQSLIRLSYAVLCLKNKNHQKITTHRTPLIMI